MDHAVDQTGPAIAFFGSWEGHSGKLIYRAMEETALLIAQAGYTILTDGGDGVGGEAPRKGAMQVDVQSLCEFTYGRGYRVSQQDHPEALRIDCNNYAAEIPFDAGYGIALSGLLEVASGFVFGCPFEDAEVLARLSMVVHRNLTRWIPNGQIKKVALIAPAAEHHQDQHMLVRMFTELTGARAVDDILLPCTTPAEAVQLLVRATRPLDLQIGRYWRL